MASVAVSMSLSIGAIPHGSQSTATRSATDPLIITAVSCAALGLAPVVYFVPSGRRRQHLE
ncbi:hypothetical protein [Mycolicibacterium mengxianglii]|uniref:hypothetical protein n=1 Tax=Mycolicibacterium mengxianglii TaxID=2736649 RepID=UPI0018EEF074|nr:hypothetical protein [Mycolicibacterium mengxianglii]